MRYLRALAWAFGQVTAALLLIWLFAVLNLTRLL